MKGMVFTEFLELVEDRMGGLAMVDRIIMDAKLPNDGAYTAVGTYDHGELVRLVVALSAATATPVPDLLRMFGEHLFQRFSLAYPDFFARVNGAFDFLHRIENVIHVEVRKLYPDAELPSFAYEEPAAGELVLFYSSPRGFGDLAEGLLHGCIAHFQEPIQLIRTDLPPVGGNQQIRFHLRREAV